MPNSPQSQVKIVQVKTNPYPFIHLFLPYFKKSDWLVFYNFYNFYKIYQKSDNHLSDKLMKICPISLQNFLKNFYPSLDKPQSLILSFLYVFQVWLK